MNFYIGNSINQIDVEDSNVEFSDELMDYIYNMSKQSKFDVSVLTNIDPYGDTEISSRDVSKIVECCELILNTSMFQDCSDVHGLNEALSNLLEISKRAIELNTGLVSIGD